MQKYIYLNGRAMQRQPYQQQQGASMMGAPPPKQPTLIGSDIPPPGMYPPPESTPVSTDATMAWIRRASDQTALDPYTYLSLARNKYHLDRHDDNLAAAERYFDALQGNMSSKALAGDAIVKAAREISIAGFKPVEKLTGRNGSKEVEYVTRSGMLGAADRASGRTHLDRLKAYSQ